MDTCNYNGKARYDEWGEITLCSPTTTRSQVVCVMFKEEWDESNVI